MPARRANRIEGDLPPRLLSALIARLHTAPERSSSRRAAIAASSPALQSFPVARLRVEISAVRAVGLDMVERRFASSHGSTSMRAKAEMTLSCIPLLSVHSVAKRNSSNSEAGARKCSLKTVPLQVYDCLILLEHPTNAARVSCWRGSVRV